MRRHLPWTLATPLCGIPLLWLYMYVHFFLLLLPCVAAPLAPLYAYLLLAGPIHACLKTVDTAYLFVWPVSMRGHSRVCPVCKPLSLFAIEVIGRQILQRYRWPRIGALACFQDFRHKFWVDYFLKMLSKVQRVLIMSTYLTSPLLLLLSTHCKKTH